MKVGFVYSWSLQLISDHGKVFVQQQLNSPVTCVAVVDQINNFCFSIDKHFQWIAFVRHQKYLRNNPESKLPFGQQLLLNLRHWVIGKCENVKLVGIHLFVQQLQAWQFHHTRPASQKPKVQQDDLFLKCSVIYLLPILIDEAVFFVSAIDHFYQVECVQHSVLVHLTDEQFPPGEVCALVVLPKQQEWQAPNEKEKEMALHVHTACESQIIFC